MVLFTMNIELFAHDTYSTIDGRLDEIERWVKMST
jgi:hypothetical protein